MSPNHSNISIQRIFYRGAANHSAIANFLTVMISIMMTQLFSSASRATMTEATKPISEEQRARQSHTEGGCVDCGFPADPVLKIPGSAFMEKQLIPRLIKTGNFGEALQRDAPADVKELERVGICKGITGETTCSILEDPCMVITSSHLFGNIQLLRNQFKGNAKNKKTGPPGDLNATNLFIPRTADGEAYDGFMESETPNQKSPPLMKKDVFEFFVERDPTNGNVDKTGMSYRAEKFVLVNPLCDLAIIKLAPNKDGQCPGDIAGRDFFKLPSKELVEKTLGKCEDTGQKTDYDKKPVMKCTSPENTAIGYYGFPNVEARENKSEKAAYRLQVGLIKKYTTYTKPENSWLKHSDCQMLEHKATTTHGNSGSPYVLVEGGNNPTPYYDYLIGMDEAELTGIVNMGSIWTPAFVENIRRAIDLNRTKLSDRKKIPLIIQGE